MVSVSGAVMTISFPPFFGGTCAAADPLPFAGEDADFEAQNCQPSTKVDTRQNVQLTTEHAFLPNACYV